LDFFFPSLCKNLPKGYLLLAKKGHSWASKKALQLLKLVIGANKKCLGHFIMLGVGQPPPGLENFL